MLSCVSSGLLSSMTEWRFSQSQYRARGKAPWVVWLERSKTGGGPVTPHLLTHPSLASNPGSPPQPAWSTWLLTRPCTKYRTSTPPFATPLVLTDMHCWAVQPPYSPQDGRQGCDPPSASPKLLMLHPEGSLGMARRVF